MARKARWEPACEWSQGPLSKHRFGVRGKRAFQPAYWPWIKAWVKARQEQGFKLALRITSWDSYDTREVTLLSDLSIPAAKRHSASLIRGGSADLCMISGELWDPCKKAWEEVGHFGQHMLEG